MKTVVNVYKDEGLWQKPPPGIGDFLRGCCYLEWKSRSANGGQRFIPRFNLDLSPASRCLCYREVHQPGDRTTLAGAPEFFDVERDGEVDTVIEDFLRSDREILYVSTNRSWRGIDDEPDRQALEFTARILNFTPEFRTIVEKTLRKLPAGYTLFHVRDRDRSEEGALRPRLLWDAWQFRRRVKKFIATELASRHPAKDSVVCVSNNVALRDRLCRKHGYANMQTEVKNTGFKGILSEGELLDVALMKNAQELVALSYFDWNSGFSVWVTRLFGVRASFFNGLSQI